MKSTVKFAIIIIIALGCFFAASNIASLGIANIPADRLKEKYYSGNLKTVTVKGLRVNYYDEGSGDVVLLLHGVCASLHTWDGWTGILKKNFRVIRLDIPGFGLTGPASDAGLYSRDRAVEFLNAFVTSLKIDRFSLAGNSLGGYLAWNYSLTYPGKVKKMILLDPIGYNQKLPFILSFASNPVVRPFARHIMPRFIFEAAVRQVYGDKKKITRRVRDRYFELAMRKGNKSAYVDIFTEIRRMNDSEKISKNIPAITVPTLVMWGTLDEWIPFEQFGFWKRDLPSARFIAYEGAGHVPMEEVPEKSVRDALDFFRSATPAR